ncbi:MAG TPA: 2-phospho-L-lactate guanylyltransferase [Thermoleophilaceae bacterium]|nr:2-phospho-L-lactate guanylyltransferase [Thermoleophilaceae bacterium]
MQTIAILPIKSFGAAKQRLAGLLGSGARQALVQAMFQDVLAALRHVPELDAIAVVTANPAAERAAHGEGVLLLADDREAGHSDAATIGVRYALGNGFDRVLLVPGDTPLLNPDEVGGLLRRAEADVTDVVVVPDRHGTGTNALLLCPPAAIEPAFGPGSCERHQALAAAAGASCRVDALPSLAIDVDTPEDLAELSTLLQGCRTEASVTRGALRQLDRSRAHAPAAVS